MKLVIQRVTSASVRVGGETVGDVGRGVLILLGVQRGDTQETAEYCATKCADLRIFPDAEGRMNRSLREEDGEALVVSQFTLLADCSKGKRPSFIDAAPPETGRALYEYFVNELKKRVRRVSCGIFGAMMEVRLINDGPVTLILERTDPSLPAKRQPSPSR